jgi:glycosyltransferase involved in cell wall biosynthesis
MRVLFFEPFHTGHHFAYFARMLPGFLDLPVELILATTPEATRSEEFARSLGPFADRLNVQACCTPPPRGKPIRNGWHRLNDLDRSITTLRPDHVAVLYSDGLWQVAAARDWIGRRPWSRDVLVEGWHFRGAFGERSRRSPKDFVERRLFRRLLKSDLFARLHLHHEILYEYARQLQQARDPHSTGPLAQGNAPTDTPRRTEVVLTADPLVLFDPVEKRKARERLGLPVEGRIVSLNGMISAWKGAVLLLAAFRKRAELLGAASERLLLAGPHDEQVQAQLSQPPFDAWRREGRIVSLNRFLSEEEMFLASAASDLVTAPYAHHPERSSVMLWASAAGRPVLGVDGGCIAHVIGAEGLGWTCHVHDDRAFAEGIQSALSHDWSESDAARVRRYAQFHSVENYQRISADLVRRRCQSGRPSHGSVQPVS